MAVAGAAAVCAWCSLPLMAQEPAAELDCGQQRVHSLGFSPDGRLLAAGNFRGQVRVWDVARRSEVKTLDAHQDEIRVLAFTADGKSLVSAVAGGDVKVWDTGTWQPSRAFNADTTYAGALSPDGKKLIAGGFGKATAIDLANGRATKEFTHGTIVVGVACSADGKLLATASESSVKLWDYAAGRELATLAGPDGGDLRSLAMSPDGKLLAAGSEQQFVYVWDVAQRKQVSRLAVGRADAVDAVAFSPDNKTLAVGSILELRLFDVATGMEVRQWRAGVTEVLAYSPDGSLLASAGMTVESQGKVEIWAVGKAVARPRAQPDIRPKESPKPGGRPPGTTRAAVRTWTSADGSYTVRASLGRVEGDVVHLKRADDGRVIPVRIDQLSDKDREYLKRP